MVVRGYARLAVDSKAPLIAYLSEESAASLRAPLLRMDRLCGLAVVVSNRLLTTQPELRHEVSGDEVAIVVGSAHGCHKTDEEYFRSFLQGQPSPRLFAYTLPSSPGGELSILYRLRGPGLAVCMGQTSGLAALAEAELLLATRQATACLVVAVEVAEPVLSASSQQDAAVALWLTREDVPTQPGLADLSPVAESFVGGQGDRALGRVLRSLPAAEDARVLCDEESAQLGAVALQGRRWEVAAVPGGAVSGLWLLGSALADGETPAVCVSVDAAGHAAAVRIERRPSACLRL